MAENLKDMVVAELDDIPAELLPEVLRFVRFIKSQSPDTTPGAGNTLGVKVVTVSAAQVLSLSGLVDISGDAYVDTERLYDE